MDDIIDFLKNNGWAENKNYDNSEYRSFYKDNNIGIDIDDSEIVLIGEEGDFLHIDINGMAVFALIGYLLTYKYIAIDYKY